MGLLICLRDEDGNELERLYDDELLKIMPDVDSVEFALLRWINPYFDVYYNELQMRYMEPELEALVERCSSESQRRALSALTQMVREGQCGHRLLLIRGLQ